MPRPAVLAPWEQDDEELIVDAAEDEEGFQRVMEMLLEELEQHARATFPPAGAVWQHGDFVASSMLQWKGGYDDGRLGHWTGADVHEYMLDYFPRKVSVDEETLDAVPECVCAFLGFLDARGSLSGEPLEQREEACETLREEFRERARDSSEWGPAKAMVMQMLAEGVDPSARGALDAWMADFNGRPREQRDAVVAPPPIAWPVAQGCARRVGRQLPSSSAPSVARHSAPRANATDDAELQPRDDAELQPRCSVRVSVRRAQPSRCSPRVVSGSVGAVLQADTTQALSFRVAGHHLDARTDPLTAVAACGLQEFPPGWAAVALHARSDGEPAPEEVVVVNAMRGAPYLVPRADVAVFTRALVPADEGLKVLVGSNSAKEVAAEGFSVREALDRVSAAARDGLAGGPLERDAFHQALRERLPAGLLPWCRGCQSHHVRPGLWRALGPLGVTEMPEKATYALAAGPAMALDDAREELARRFLRCHGPATHSHLASWAQTAPAHAKALLKMIEDELEAVKVGGSRRWILAEDAGRLEAPPPARGVRLLGGFDPYVAQPDRDALVPDSTIRKQLFPPVGRPGVILHDGGVAGLWRSRKQGDLLEITPVWIGEPVDLAEEAAVVAGLRGCARGAIG